VSALARTAPEGQKPPFGKKTCLNEKDRAAWRSDVDACRVVLEAGQRPVEVIGPSMESDEAAAALYDGAWHR